MAQGKAHDESLVRQIMAELITGAAISALARKYQLSKSVVSGIKARITPEQIERCRTRNERDLVRNEETPNGFDGLLVESLRDHLRMQKAITEIASEPEYLRRQTASDLAKLLEVSQDHTIRLLEAASAGEE
jgi:acyl CoA:acetate/3-ketoacid CoA transferase alpha subunit